MDNREVLVKLQYTTKYGVQLTSSRVIRNYNLFKHLTLKHIPEQVYIDYSNEDCELVNLKNLLDNASIISDKKQIESFNNLKQLLYKDVNTQYDLFTLIDNAYNDVFGCTVEKDLAFDKYSYFYKQLLDLSKSLMNKYMEYIGTDEFPKDINQLYMKELENDKYNQLIEWLYEPIINDVNINCLINCILNDSCGSNTIKSNNKTTFEIPLHKNAQSRIVDDINKSVPLKEKVIIAKNSSGLYTFKDLVFNLKTSLVIGKWNSQTQNTDKLSQQDIELCKNYNLKYDESQVSQTIEENNNVVNIIYNTTNQDNLEESSNEQQGLVTNVTQQGFVTNVTHQMYEQKKAENSSNSTENKVNDDNKLNNFFNNLIKEQKSKVLEQTSDENEEEQEQEQVKVVQVTENVMQNILNQRELSLVTNTVELSGNLELSSENLNEDSGSTVDTQVLNPYSSTIIPIVNDKVSRGRKKASTVTVGTTSLKQKATVPRKTGK